MLYQPSAAKGPEAMLVEQIRKPTKAPNLSDHHPLIAVHIRPPQGELNTFQIPRSFLCYYSGYFEAALNAGSREIETQEMVLEGVSTEVFSLFANWLYTQVLVSDTSCWPSHSTLIDLWLFADRIRAPKLHNLAFIYLDRARKQLPEKRNILENGSPLRYVLDTRNSKNNTKIPERNSHQSLFGLAGTRLTDMHRSSEMSADINMGGTCIGHSNKRKMMDDRDTTADEQWSSPGRLVKRMRAQASC
ncbi:hypothetical protein LHYA1_G003506 [Lachnellula hyalina]|uniref:BTB domain-containing protein n=1 Tax=Lachnellula hyalina TaxID=1316788 RepID=A0A8H8R5L2_9HELO|nr:uncharacterized protein LHYA1_G003506 [Lachnellula hyalina]TVY27945.1 hypothetical protein LHYA1_G003506 [Lachnellula hyalina]